MGLSSAAPVNPGRRPKRCVFPTEIVQSRAKSRADHPLRATTGDDAGRSNPFDDEVVR